MASSMVDSVPTLPVRMGEQVVGRIPQLGLGTYKVDPAAASATVQAALQAGYRHIDGAQMYQNEAQVGAGLVAGRAALGLGRKELFLTSKLNNGNHLPADVHASFQRTLNELQVDYVDLFLMHWPLPTLYGGDFVTTYLAMVEIWQSGAAKAIGVSNFQTHHLDTLLAATAVVPAVNQIEAHPYFPNDQVRAYNAGRGILTQTSSPLARGKILTDPLVKELAAKLERTPAQVALRWAIERGDITFPKASTPERLAENLAIFDFSLDEEAHALLASLDGGEAGRVGSHPDTMARI